MKIKTMLKFLLCFLIIGNLQICEVTAVEAGGLSATKFFESADFDSGFGKGNMNDAINTIFSSDTSLKDPLLHIQSLIIFIGSLAAVIVVIIYGIQWVTAPAAKRQDLKAGLWPLTIGVSLLVLGPRLVPVIYGVISANSNQTVVRHVNTVAGNIITVVQTIGYIAAIVMIFVAGIQWLTATPNKRQELKGRMIHIIIGAILIVGGVTILGWVSNIATYDMQKTSSMVNYKT